MRANEFGTNPKRPQREGSRPSRGHEPLPRYTNEQQSVEETARMSAAVKLQRAFDRERSKSDASRQRADAAKAEFEREWKAKQEKEKQGVAEGSLNEVTQGVEHSEWTDNVRDAYPGVKIIKKRTEDGRHIKSQAILNGQLVGQYNMNTGVGTFKAPKQQGVAEGSEPDAYGRTGEKHECGSCDGTGIDTYDDECPECGGKGWVRDKESLKKQGVAEGWSKKYKSSINCSHPKGFSQKAHCAGKKKHNESIETEMTCPDCGMCQTHGSLNEIKKGAKDSNGFTKCWSGYHAAGTKKGKNGKPVRNCVPNESIAETIARLEAELESLAEEGKASRKLCASSTPDSELGASQLASCKSQGLRSRDGNKSHKLGKSPKSRVKVGGHKIKGQKYGGPLPDWS